MYICSRVPTRCTALARTARQNSARPYYLRFVSWLQTITHFPGSSHLSPFLWLALYHPHSLHLFLSCRATPSYLFICTATLSPPPPPPSPLPQHCALSFSSSIAFTLLFLRMAMCALCSEVMVSLLNYHQLQISFYFGKVLIHTHARHDRTRQDEMKFVRLFVARDRSVRCRKVFRRLKAATGEK